MSHEPGSHRQHHKHHDGHAHGGRDRHGNPLDFEHYLARLDDPGRRAQQRPEEVVAALELRPGQVVAEIGPGTGMFTMLLAAAVGGEPAAGHVFACEVEPRLLGVLAERLAAADVSNVAPVLSRTDDPLLPLASCDLILLANAYHHLSDGPAYLHRLHAALRPGGRLAIVDLHRIEEPEGPPLDHRVAREDTLAAARAAGFRLQTEYDFLGRQYFLILERPAR